MLIFTVGVGATPNFGEAIGEAVIPDIGDNKGLPALFSPEEYFVDGITEDIISFISRYRWLSVIARNSTFVYKGKAVDVREVAKDLEVDYVVEGSVRKAGARIRVTAQLIEAQSGSHLWTERYDRNLDDIFALQDEITNHCCIH